MAKYFMKIIVNHLKIKSIKFRCKNLNKISYVCINSFFMQDFLDGFKDFGAWLIITHLGRICLAGIIMFSGAILVNLDKSPILFYVGMALFCIEFIVLIGAMIWNVINDFL